MKSNLLFIMMGVVAVACYSKTTDLPGKRNAGNCLKATVVKTRNIDCGLPELSFAEDSASVTAVTGKQGLVYVAKYLPDSLNVAGKKLCVTVAQLKPEEDFMCTMLGITYPHIKVVSATAR